MVTEATKTRRKISQRVSMMLVLGFGAMAVAALALSIRAIPSGKSAARVVSVHERLVIAAENIQNAAAAGRQNEAVQFAQKRRMLLANLAKRSPQQFRIEAIATAPDGASLPADVVALTETAETLTGTVARYLFDDSENQTSAFYTTLLTDTGVPYVMIGEDAALSALDTAQRATITGIALPASDTEGALLIPNAADGITVDKELLLTATAEAGTVRTQRVLALLMTFHNDHREPRTREEISTTMYQGLISLSQSAYDRIQFTWESPGDIIGWFDARDASGAVDLPTVCPPGGALAFADDLLSWAQFGAQDATGESIDLSQYDQVLVFSGNGSLPCSLPTAFTRYVGNTQHFFKGISDFLISHEVGHGLEPGIGVDHYDFYACPSTGGTQQTFTDSCNKVDYGGVYSIMGMQANELGAQHKERLGIFTNEEIAIADAPGVYQLVGMSDTTKLGYRTLKIPRVFYPPDFSNPQYQNKVSEWFYLEYRPRVRMDSTVPAQWENGVLVYYNRASIPRSESSLLDMHPSGTVPAGVGAAQTALQDAALATGESWTDPLGSGVTITTLGLNAAGYMQVQVSYPEKTGHGCVLAAPTIDVGSGSVMYASGATEVNIGARIVNNFKEQENGYCPAKLTATFTKPVGFAVPSNSYLTQTIHIAPGESSSVSTKLTPPSRGSTTPSLVHITVQPLGISGYAASADVSVSMQSEPTQHIQQE
ncbi:MAG: hypothetical protein WCV86_03780 [Patescibacteria group bacterium]